MSSSTIKTSRLLLRAMREDDAASMRSITNQPSVAQNMSDMILADDQAAREWIAWINGQCGADRRMQLLCAELQATGEVIGYAGVAPQRTLGGEVEILFAIADPHQGQGYATEAGKAMIWWAFEQAGCDQLSAIVKTHNAASRRVIEKLGFIHCDTRRLPHDGEEHDFDYFRLYHQDWLPSPEWDYDQLYALESMDAFFNARASGYDEHMLTGRGEAAYERLTEYLPASQERVRILDLGCGTGIELKYIWRQMPNACITCVDVSREMLDLLVKAYPDRQAQIEVVEASYVSWQAPEHAYDIVISSNTMHHLWPEEKVAVYRTIRKALKLGGFYLEDDFIVDEPQSRQYARRYHRILERAGSPKALPSQYHIDIPLTVDAQLKLLREAGFSRVASLYENIRPSQSGAILRAEA